MGIHPLNNSDDYQAKLKPEATLMKMLGFTEEDLADNQEVKMSDNQRLRCLNQRDKWLVGGLLLGFVFVAIWLGAREAVLHLVILAGVIFVCGQQVYRYHTDATKGIVAMRAGRIGLDRLGRRFWIEIDDMRFILKREAFLVFNSGDSYRVYYSPQSKMLLSVERLWD